MNKPRKYPVKVNKKHKERQKKGTTMDLFFAMLGMCIKLLAGMLEALVDLIGCLLEGLFGESSGGEKRPSRPRSPGRQQPLVVIRTDRPVSAGQVTRKPDGGGTYRGICFACHGTGVFPATHTPCRRCKGTGIYRKSW